jgi:hypothetical protein
MQQHEKTYVFFLDYPFKDKVVMWPGYLEYIEDDELDEIKKHYQEVKDFKITDLYWDAQLANSKYIVFEKLKEKETKQTKK